jgi:hypothetical protein
MGRYTGEDRQEGDTQRRRHAREALWRVGETPDKSACTEGNVTRVGDCMSLMLRRHLINLAETVTEKEFSERFVEISLVISWLGTGVARALRMNASEPMVGWRGEHPQSVGW